MANVSQLQPALTPQVQTISSEALEKNADFLALRLLNKRARLRLSPSPIDPTNLPGKASLFAIANSKGWFAAVTREDARSASAMILSPLADLRSALVAASAEDEQSYRPQRRVLINAAAPHILTFACNDTRILLGQIDGSIQVYASDQLLFPGEDPVQPIHVCAASSSMALLSMQPNPGEIPELVAILRDCANSPGSLAVELFDVQKLTSSGGWMTGKSPSTTPTSISWSPKGKQLALGLQSGDIVCFSPTATAIPKSSIPHPPAANNMSVISVHWLSASSFHTIYAPPGQLTPEAEQIHFHVSLDSKSNSAQAIRFNNPYLPFPGLRPPGEFLVSLRGWDPSKVLLFIGDGTSSDIGLIGTVVDDAGERWHNLALEETSTPSLPLDKDQNDTILLGMGVDLTYNESYHHSTDSGEALELPAHPIMYVYASDGTVLGWHVLNVTGAPYPGMITTIDASTPALSVPSIPSSIVRELSSDMQTTPIISPVTSAVAEAVAMNPSTGSDQPSAFDAQGSTFIQTPVFGQPQFGFGKQPTSTFGEASSFGQSATTPTFGSVATPSAFGQPLKPAFGSAAPVGFGAFSSAGPAKFGQPTFGFGGPPQAASTLPSSTSVPEESMAADDIPSLGDLGLGTTNSQDPGSKSPIFGKTSVPVSANQQSTDGNLIKPGTGFGAFAGFDEKSPFAATTGFSSVQQPAATFGFGAFASGNQSAFAIAASKTDPSAKPVWATGDISKPLESSPFGAPTNTFGKPTESPETGTLSATFQAIPSAFVKPASGAFGELPKHSPFFAPKPPEPKSVSAFALSATPTTPTSTPPRASSIQPAFGMSSMPGVGLQKSQDADVKPSIFSKTNVPVSSDSQATDGSLMKPGTGFGAFSSTTQSTGAFAFGSFSSGAQSAFAVAASKNSPSTKPVWATDDSSRLAAESHEPKTPSAMPPKTTDASTTPPFTTTSTYSVSSQFVPRDSMIRDDESRSPSPAPVLPKVTTSSVFSSSIPGPTTGAFSNLHTTPSAFVKPASGGFGELPKDSPFFAPKPPESKPVSVFALPAAPTTPISTPPKASTAQPTFGAISMPGGAPKSAFPPVAVASTQSAPVVSAGGFSAFSSGGGGFTAFSSGGSKSFGDLLRSTKEEKAQSAEPSEVTPTKPTQAPPQPPVSTTPVKEPPKSPSTLPVISQPEGKEETLNAVEVTASKESAEPKEKGAETILIQESSLESISSSTSSSFVKVSAEEEDEVTGEAEQGEDAESLPSSEVPSEAEESQEEEPGVSEEEESGVSDEEESEVSEEEALSEATDGEERVLKEIEPTEIPLPITPASTRSPSTTPKAEPPKISAPVSPPPQPPSPSVVPRVSPVRDLGTTPPGSPVKDTPSVPVQMPIPTLKASALPISPFGLAPRSNNRPIRSSPLASSPLVLESEVEKPPPVSRSAPPAMVAQPAAPKAPFGQWTLPPPPPAQLADDSVRPSTPPISSSFPSLVEKPAPPIFTPASTPTPAPSPFTPSGKVTTTTPGPSAPVFTPPTAIPSFAPSTAMPSGHGTPSFTPPVARTPTPVPPPTPTPEQGMQAECLFLETTLTKELDNLKQLATAASLKTEELRKTSGVTHQKVDLSDPDKWAFGDIEEYGGILVDVQTDIKELKLQRVPLRKAMKELNSNMLKVNTRKEEIARFQRAKTDAEFAKMLKIRTLAPESSETQSQLRRNIRVIRDRVQKLEDHLQASKKRINEFRTGRPSIRPPSLDTVNRTFRNIDTAIDQQKQEISLLRYRMARLEVSGSVATREQLTLSSVKRPLNVTTNVAITTAAALNAERSAQRLKKAILASRTRPLLNTTAVASPAPTSFQTPQKVVEPDVKTTVLKTPDSALALPTTPTMSFPSSLPGWTPPPSSSSELGSPTSPFDNTPSRNRGGTKHHQKPIVLKKSASPGGPAQPAIGSPFEWKQVEPIRPVSSLPFALRPAGSS